jgi:aminopeptidase N
LRVKHIRLGDQELPWVQEDWEGGFTVFLPKAASAGDAMSLYVDLQGPFFQVLPVFPECFYPFSNETWFPRHGYLDRATFDLTFRYRKRDKIASVGTRVSDDPDPEDPQAMIAHYVLNHPVALATFAVGPWERKAKQVTFESGGPTIPVEFNSVPARVLAKTSMTAVNDDLILNELDNAVRYFAAIFGPYPYDSFSAAFHPFNFGQSAATLLMIPPATNGRESNVFHFFSHETAHQWWGHVVLWRSYRDQWLSEGFAEYSSVLYAAKRGVDANKTTAELVGDMRRSLLDVPLTLTGAGKGRLNDIGPIVLGHRLNTTKTQGAYQALIYSKGALVLRMLQFLLSNPANGNDVEFQATMKDFTSQHREGSASTEDFWSVASQHFARTPIAAKFNMQNLDWFFREWVYDTGLPTYQMEYETVAQSDGSLMLKGTVKQTNVDSDFQMVLPLVMTFEGNQQARSSVRVVGASSTFELKVPQKPLKVELDPFNWVLSEKTTSKAK